MRTIKRWLATGFIGLIMVIIGLAWDAAMHAADPALAAEEGPLTLSNPSHALATVGLFLLVLALSGAAWSAWRPSWATMGSRLTIIGTGLGAMMLVAGGVWALDGGAEDHHDTAEHEHTELEMSESHHHDLAPFPDRYAAASEEDRVTADALLAETQATLAGYQDVDEAVAAGFLPPKDPTGTMWHYRLPGAARDSWVLDPEHPEGLVYWVPPNGREPMLAGAFFLAAPGDEAVKPAGDLVLWHSHNCESFNPAPEQCLDTTRMLHVWTFDEVTVTHPRTDREVTVEVIDPFGAPFSSSIDKSD